MEIPGARISAGPIGSVLASKLTGGARSPEACGSRSTSFPKASSNNKAVSPVETLVANKLPDLRRLWLGGDQILKSSYIEFMLSTKAASVSWQYYLSIAGDGCFVTDEWDSEIVDRFFFAVRDVSHRDDVKILRGFG